MITRRQVVATGAALAATASANAQDAKQGAGNMKITRSGSQPSRKGAAQNFVGVVRVNSPFRGSDPRACRRRVRHVRARRPHRVAHASARSNSHCHGRSRVGAKRGWSERGNPPRRHRLDSAGRKTLARRDSDARHDTYRHFRGSRREDRGLDGAGIRRPVSEMIFHASPRPRPHPCNECWKAETIPWMVAKGG